MTTQPRVQLTVTDGLAELRLDDPDRGNALGPQLGADLRAQAEALGSRDDVRVVVLTSGGKAFCVGGDIRFFGAAEDPETTLRALAADLHGAIRALMELEAPVIARVHGAAAGAGLSLVCAADIAIAGSSAAFTCAYTRIGLSPDGGQSYFLPRLIGPRRAMDLMLTNRRVGAAEAQAIGLVTEVVDDADLDARVADVTQALADGPTAAYGATKVLLRDSWLAGLDDHLDGEADSIATLAGTPEGREGVAAFLGKREPDFRAC